jgi:hypothetical protein
MNNEFVHARAAGFADRLLADATQDRERLRLAFQRTLGREPRNDELNESMSFVDDYRKAIGETGMLGQELERAAWSGFSRTLLTRNEFLFVD